MLPQAYLTERQLEIWKLQFKGLSKAEVGRRLGINRQAVYDVYETRALNLRSLTLRYMAWCSGIEVSA